jgi:retinol-binding protein 3
MLFLIVVAACGAQVSIPDTPAGLTLQAWLDTFKSADKSKIETYVKTIDHNQSVDGMLGFRNGTGGFDLLSIESSEPLHVRFLVKEKSGDTRAIGTITVKDGQPPTVETFGLRALPPGVEPVNVVLDGDLRKKTIDGVASAITDYYVDPDLAKKMTDAIQSHAKGGDYDKISDGTALAEKLTSDLRDMSHDKHLRVDFNPFKMPRRTRPPRRMRLDSISKWSTTTAPSRRWRSSPGISATSNSMASWMPVFADPR